MAVRFGPFPCLLHGEIHCVRCRGTAAYSTDTLLNMLRKMEPHEATQEDIEVGVRFVMDTDFGGE